MLQPLLIKKTCSNYLYYLLLMATMAMVSCKKADQPKPEEVITPPIEFSYEVNCDHCDITFTDKSNQNRTITSNNGKWTYKIDTKITFELKLAIKTTLSSYQSIQAYILKNGEVVYGNLGYNYANLAYHTTSAQGSSSFGSYTSSGSSGGNGGGGSTAPASSLCGAKNKTGGYCKRVVIGGGRCWQHK